MLNLSLALISDSCMLLRYLLDWPVFICLFDWKGFSGSSAFIVVHDQLVYPEMVSANHLWSEILRIGKTKWYLELNIGFYAG